MSYHISKKDRQRRRKKLVEGYCGCGAKAQIPWEGGKYCYKCFTILMKELKEAKK